MDEWQNTSFAIFQSHFATFQSNSVLPEENCQSVIETMQIIFCLTVSVWLHLSVCPAGKDKGKAPISGNKKVAKARESSHSGSESEKPGMRPGMKKSVMKKVCIGNYTSDYA